MEKPLQNVLLVEDNEGDIELTKIAFKKAGLTCQLAVVYDGEEGIDYLYRRGKFGNAPTPDVILVDINMPRMGGKEFLDVIKGDELLKVIPVIMLTSSRAPAEIVDCYQRHANCYILKPSGLEAFINIARQIQTFWLNLVELPYDDQEPASTTH